MPARGREVELLGEGMKVNAPDRGSFYQNMWFKQGEWRNRPGFGQLAQIDTTLSLPHTDKISEYGYTKRLLSHAMVTDFGHVQVLTLLEGKVFTGNVEDDTVGFWTDAIFLSIYDETSGARWEEVLHRHTSEAVETLSLPWVRGVHRTNQSGEYSDYVGIGDEPWFFHEYQDRVFFGSPDVGLFVYLPCDFTTVPRRQQVDGTSETSYASGFNESALVRKLTATVGAFGTDTDYIDDASFPVPVDAVDVDGRLALASGRTVWFSDRNWPTQILAGNNVQVASDRPITAMDRLNDQLYVFTAGSVDIYQPSRGDLSSRGQWVPLSDSDGALWPSAVCRGEDKLFWMDLNGVYMTGGGLSYQRISDDIEPFFHDYISNPLTSYWVNNGFANLSNVPPRTVYDFNDPDRASLSYDTVNKRLFVTVPSQGISLVWDRGVWSLWNYESLADTGGEVAGTNSLFWPQLLTIDDRVLMVCGTELYSPFDGSEAGGLGVGEALNAVSGSYFVLEHGRGGNLDRTVEDFEDLRGTSGFFRKQEGVVDGSVIWLGEPVPLEDLYEFPAGRIRSNCVLVPVHAKFANTWQIDQIHLTLRFDNSLWRVVTQGAADPKIEMIFPPERHPSRLGWGINAPVAGASESQVYNHTGGTNPTGNEARFHWDGTAATAGVGYSAPYMNVNDNHRNPLFYFALERLDASTDAMSFGFDVQVASYRYAGPTTGGITVFHWVHASPASLHEADDVAQPLDWVVLPKATSFEGAQMLARVLYMRVRSSGKAVSVIKNDSTFGLFNTIIFSDQRKVAAQIIDFASEGIQRVVDKLPIRARMQPTAGVNDEVTYNDVATWGDTGNSANGNVLLGDEPVDDIAVSDRVRGSEVSVMLFGHLRNRAERVGVSSLRMMYRLRGGRRVRGR